MEGKCREVNGAAAARDERDGQATAWRIADLLHEAHAKAGIPPGPLPNSRLAIEQVLLTELDWDDFQRRVLAQHAAWVNYWATDPKAFKPQVARWIRDGDWVHAPAASAAAPAARPLKAADRVLAEFGVKR